ncbi:MAG: hypothetical protein NT007_04405 [Candidatus Kapabacteria bacterium]|nr:hypothetical protein [Candidatus Kapabacteria bacterium]
MSDPNNTKELIDILRQWQKIEDISIRATTEIIVNAKNPLIHLIMEIIRHDSTIHYRVQSLLLNHLEGKKISFDFASDSNYLHLLKEHDAHEKQTIVLAKQALENTDSIIVKFLLEYLLTDEKKHDVLMENINKLIEDNKL